MALNGGGFDPARLDGVLALFEDEARASWAATALELRVLELLSESPGLGGRPAPARRPHRQHRRPSPGTHAHPLDCLLYQSIRL